MAIKTTKDLCTLLCNELDDLANGKTTPQDASAKVKVVNSIVGVKKLEIDIGRFVSDTRLKTINL